MSWIKKEKDVEEIEELGGSSLIQASNAYEVEITGARLAKGKETESLSLVIEVKNDVGETAREFFTVNGRDGKTYFLDKRNGAKKQHIGLTIVNSLFQLVLDKEIFEVEPVEIEYKVYNKDTEEFETTTADGFPELIGKKVGVCVQIERTVEGENSREQPRIEHFFNVETGLFNKEEAVQGAKTKLDKWLDRKKDFKEIIKEVKKSSFGKVAETKTDEVATVTKSKWGR